MSRGPKLTATRASPRRALTRGQAIAAGAGLAAAAALGAAPVARAETETDREIAVLGRLIRVERSTAAAYEAAADRGALERLAGGRQGGGPKLFREQELAHLAALSDALAEIGGDTALPGAPPPPTPPPPDAGERRLAEWIIRLEEAALAAYLDGHRRLRGGGVRATLTSIMATEGQHLAMLRLAVNRPPVPRAFETGRPRAVPAPSVP